jgi:hypothetical protein
MINVTKARKALEDKYEELPHQTKVRMGQGEYGNGRKLDEVKMILRVLVGKPSPEAEDAIDELYLTVPTMLNDDATLNGIVADAMVTRCGGHQLFGNGAEAQLGSEWTILVRGDE